MSEFNEHQTVLENKAVDALNINPSGTYIDCTFGRGGHSRLILEKLNDKGKLIAIDKDQEAINWGKTNFLNEKRIEFINDSFTCIDRISKDRNLINSVDGVLLDLGVSFPQLSDPKRGFSFMKDGPLDMRMDQTKGITAKEWLNTASEKEIASVLWSYGEERASRKIAEKIVEIRKDKAFETTKDLALLCEKFIKKQRVGKHPGTKVFQAIRIYINYELDDLKRVLEQVLNVLKKEGRLVVISFHSLEDRIVKQFMRKLSSCNVPHKVPLKACEIITKAKLVGKKIKPDEKELGLNPRSRSAIMRVLEKKDVSDT